MCADKLVDHHNVDVPHGNIAIVQTEPSRATAVPSVCHIVMCVCVWAVKDGRLTTTWPTLACTLTHTHTQTSARTVVPLPAHIYVGPLSMPPRDLPQHNSIRSCNMHFIRCHYVLFSVCLTTHFTHAFKMLQRNIPGLAVSVIYVEADCGLKSSSHSHLDLWYEAIVSLSLSFSFFCFFRFMCHSLPCTFHYYYSFNFNTFCLCPSNKALIILAVASVINACAYDLPCLT